MAGRFRHLIRARYSKTVFFLQDSSSWFISYVVSLWTEEWLSLSSSWLKLIESVLSYMMQGDWSKTQLLYTSIVYSWTDCINSFLRYFITGKHRSVWKQYRDNRAWQRTFTFARLSSRRYTVGWRRKGRIGIRVPRTKRKGGRLERRKRSKSVRATRIYMSFFTTPYSHAL